jgi:hypothetical protein
MSTRLKANRQSTAADNLLRQCSPHGLIRRCRRSSIFAWDSKIRKLENGSTTADIWTYLLVPVSNATTATGRGAGGFFLDVCD